MKIVRITSLILILTTILLSCKKKSIQYEFNGVVTQSSNNNGVSGVSVAIKQKLFSNSVSSNYFSNAGSATTGSDGSYSIVFDREKVTEFKFIIQKDNFFNEELIVSSSEITTEDPNIRDFNLDAEAWVKFDVYNLNPEVDDQLTFITYNFREGCEGCTTNDYFYYDGAVNTSWLFKTTGGEYVKFTYADGASGASTTDSIYATPFDTTSYYLEY